MPSLRPRESLIALDLLRFAAALLVVRFHYHAMWLHDPTPLVVALMRGVARSGPIDAISTSGWVGVQIFFVLSGYVIAASARRGSAGDFAWRRWLRLWPAAGLCSVLTLGVLLRHGAAPQELVVPALASASLWPVEPLIDPSYWTLGIECSFYALVALLMAAGRWRPLAVAYVLMIASALFWTWAFATRLDGMQQRDRVAELLLLRHGALFALGILLQLHHGGARVPVAAFAVAAFGGAMSVVFGSVSAEQLGLEARPFVALALFGAGAGVVAVAPRLQAPLGALRLARPALWLGLATYPLYLLHQRIGLAMIGDLVRAGVPTAQAQAATVAMLVAVALVIANLVEPALRRRLDRLRERAPSVQATSPWPSPR